jgi:hypothetical protein
MLYQEKSGNPGLQEDRFPLFTAVHKICIGEIPAANFIACLRDHPVHVNPTEYAHFENSSSGGSLDNGRIV